MPRDASGVREEWLGRAPKVVAGAAACFYCGLALLYATGIPAGGGPDEREHLQYVRVIGRYGRLPLLPPSAGPQDDYRKAEQAQHPPLYYVLLAVLNAVPLRGLPEENSAIALRFLCVLVGLTALFVVWRAGRLLWPDAPWRAAVAVSFVALLPQTQYMDSVVNNSNGALLLGAGIVLLCVRSIGAPPWRPRDWLLLGLAVAGLLCTKMTGLWVLPLCAFSSVAKMRADGASGRRRLANGLLVVLPATLLVGPWLLRNQAVYGTPVPERVTTRHLPGGVLGLLYPPCALAFAQATYPEVLMSFSSPCWLFREQYQWPIALPVTAAFFLPAAVGLVAALRRRLHLLRGHRWTSRHLWWAGVAASLALSATLAQYIFVRDTDALIFLGRYAWEAASAVGLAWTLGMFSFPWPRIRRVLAGATLAGMAVMSIWVCNQVLGFYRLHPL